LEAIFFSPAQPTDATSTRATGIISAAQLSVIGQNPTSYIVENLIPTEGIVILGGQSKSGKSFLAIDLCLSVSKGIPVFGRYPSKPTSVLYLNQDMSTNAFGHRYIQLSTGKGIDTNNPSFMSSDQFQLNLADDESLAILEERIKESAAKLVVIDTFAASFQGNEQDSKQMRQVFISLKAITQRLKIAILLVDHHGKRLRGITGNGAKSAFSEAVLAVHRLQNGRAIFEVVCNRHSNNEGESLEFQLKVDEQKAVIEIIADKDRTDCEFYDKEANKPDAAKLISNTLSFQDWKTRKDIEAVCKANEISVKQMDAALKTLIEDGRVKRMQNLAQTGRGNKGHIYRLAQMELKVAA
jgi:hypothetical protein